MVVYFKLFAICVVLAEDYISDAMTQWTRGTAAQGRNNMPYANWPDWKYAWLFRLIRESENDCFIASKIGCSVRTVKKWRGLKNERM